MRHVVMHRTAWVLMVGLYFLSMSDAEPLGPQTKYGQASRAPVAPVVEEARRIQSEGDQHFNAHKYAEAEDKYRASLRLFEELSDKPGVAGCFYKLGRVYGRVKNYDKAVEALEKALKLHEELGDTKGIASDVTEIAEIELSRSRYVRAIE